MRRVSTGVWWRSGSDNRRRALTLSCVCFSADRQEVVVDRWDWTRVSGPLAPYAAGYDRWLVDQGYAPLSRPGRVRQFDDLSHRLRRVALSAGQLAPARVGQFVAGRGGGGPVAWGVPFGVRVPPGD